MKCPLCFILLFFYFPLTAIAEEGLTNCATAFPGATVSNAPTKGQSPANQPASGNVHLCYHKGQTAYLALEYRPADLSAIWVAYRLSNHYGKDGCHSIPRKNMQCYFKKENVQECVQKLKFDPKTNTGGDPFHADETLVTLNKTHLNSNPYKSTGHDRGHLAPNNAFSWNLCATYNTFTMANMSPQIAAFNRHPWQQLERQVLYWAVKYGPIYVVTGPIYKKFPDQAFEIYRSGMRNPDLIVPPNSLLKKKDGATLDPAIPVPTGYFKVIYKPKRGNSKAKAVAYLMPHTGDTSLNYNSFIASVAVVEKASGLRFGFANSLKNGGGQTYWIKRSPPSGWQLRSQCSAYQPKEWKPDLIKAQRISRCQ